MRVHVQYMIKWAQRLLGYGAPRNPITSSTYGSLRDAINAGDVVRGDILRVRHLFGDQRLLYKSWNAANPLERQYNFHPEHPYRDMADNTIVMEGHILEWEKAGHTTPQEWTAEMKKIFPENYPQDPPA